MDILLRIKWLAARGAVGFTQKARDEADIDDLSRNDVIESLLNASAIDKTIRSRRPGTYLRAERLYVIKSRNDAGTLIYTKGKIVQDPDEEVFILVSAKLSA